MISPACRPQPPRFNLCARLTDLNFLSYRRELPWLSCTLLYLLDPLYGTNFLPRLAHCFIQRAPLRPFATQRQPYFLIVSCTENASDWCSTVSRYTVFVLEYYGCNSGWGDMNQLNENAMVKHSGLIPLITQLMHGKKIYRSLPTISLLGLIILRSYGLPSGTHRWVTEARAVSRLIHASPVSGWVSQWQKTIKDSRDFRNIG